jgi:glucose-1-phosphate adenylyltransferase
MIPTIEFGRTLVMILAGGEGRRLYPLTIDRAKPAVPFGGRYRIIDIVLSNFVNSGLSRIKILTQYKSASLEEHIARMWRLSPMLDSYIETIPAQQRTGTSWYKGSADAVFQCQHVIDDERPARVCVFGGDHVYKMDVRQMLAFHAHKRAVATVAAIPVPAAEASQFGVLEINEDGRILGFHEKVEHPPQLPGKPGYCLASMGNYVFETAPLLHELARDAELSDDDSKHDFGRDILPHMVRNDLPVYAYDFMTNVVPGEDATGRGYWRDIGHIGAYWQAQMDLIDVAPQFNLYNMDWPIRTGSTNDPPAKFVFHDEANSRVGIATDSMVSHGCIISGGRIHRSVLSNGCRVHSFSEVQSSVLFERVIIGRHAKLKRCIVDKDVEIPAGVTIGYDLDADRKRFTVTDDGIVVIPKRARIEAC